MIVGCRDACTLLVGKIANEKWCPVHGTFSERREPTNEEMSHKQEFPVSADFCITALTKGTLCPEELALFLRVDVTSLYAVLNAKDPKGMWKKANQAKRNLELKDEYRQYSGISKLVFSRSEVYLQTQKETVAA